MKILQRSEKKPNNNDNDYETEQMRNCRGTQTTLTMHCICLLDYRLHSVFTFVCGTRTIMKQQQKKCVSIHSYLLLLSHFGSHSSFHFPMIYIQYVFEVGFFSCGSIPSAQEMQFFFLKNNQAAINL